MSHCNQCGRKANPEAKFCEECGVRLSSSINSDNAHDFKTPIEANLKVVLTNETTEQFLKKTGGIFNSIINTIKKLIKPVIIIFIVGAIITWTIQLSKEAEGNRRFEKHTVEIEQRNAQVKKWMAFEKEKILGTFQISGMTLNRRNISYGTGRVIISEKELVIHVDWNRDNHLSKQEKKVFMIKSISKSTNPENYNYGLIETDIDKNIKFIIKGNEYEIYLYTNLNGEEPKFNYNILYKLDDDYYKLWLN